MIRLAIALVIASSITCAAQETIEQQPAPAIQFGVKAGSQIASYSYEITSTGSIAIEPRSTFLIGGVVTVPVIGILDVDSGLELTWKGAKRETPIATITASPAYLQIPVKLVANVGSFRLGLGGYAAYGVGGSITISNSLLGTRSESIDFDDDDADGMSPLDLGIAADVAFKLEQFRLGLYTYNGLSNTIPKAGRSDDDFIGNWVFGFSLTYMF